jgi:hypothetical protein
MHFITGLVVGYTIGFVFALFLFSWFNAMSEDETEHAAKKARTTLSMRPN